jgi:hypothetical protein
MIHLILGLGIAVCLGMMVYYLAAMVFWSILFVLSRVLLAVVLALRWPLRVLIPPDRPRVEILPPLPRLQQQRRGVRR